MYIFVEWSIDVAHHLPNVPEWHKCGKVHGHRYEIRIEVEGEVDPTSGWIMDYETVKGIADPIIVRGLDHTNLNDILENPTCENLVEYLREKLFDKLPGLVCIEIRETARAGAGWRWGDLPW